MLEKWQNRALRHIARSAVHVSRERTQDLHRCKFGGYSGQRDGCEDHAVSAPAQTNDSVNAATSAQLQIEGHRNGWEHASNQGSVDERTNNCLIVLGNFFTLMGMSRLERL